MFARAGVWMRKQGVLESRRLRSVDYAASNDGGGTAGSIDTCRASHANRVL